MGFLKMLGKLGAIGAAPFTGGASLSAIPLMDVIGAAGTGMSAGSNAAANNRGQKFGGQMDLASLLQQRDIANARLLADADNDFTANQISREQEGRAGQQDAWRKLLSAQRVTNPGMMPTVSPYAAPQRQATHAELTGATALSEEVRNRLINGNPIAAIERRGSGMTFDPRSVVDTRLLDAGKGEKVTGWLGAFLQSIGGGREEDGPMDERPRPTGYTSPRVTTGMRF